MTDFVTVLNNQAGDPPTSAITMMDMTETQLCIGITDLNGGTNIFFLYDITTPQDEYSPVSIKSTNMSDCKQIAINSKFLTVNNGTKLDFYDLNKNIWSANEYSFNNQPFNVSSIDNFSIVQLSNELLYNSGDDSQFSSFYKSTDPIKVSYLSASKFVAVTTTAALVFNLTGISETPTVIKHALTDISCVTCNDDYILVLASDGIYASSDGDDFKSIYSQPNLGYIDIDTKSNSFLVLSSTAENSSLYQYSTIASPLSQPSVLSDSVSIMDMSVSGIYPSRLCLLIKNNKIAYVTMNLTNFNTSLLLYNSQPQTTCDPACEKGFHCDITNFQCVPDAPKKPVNWSMIGIFLAMGFTVLLFGGAFAYYLYKKKSNQVNQQ